MPPTRGTCCQGRALWPILRCGACSSSSVLARESRPWPVLNLACLSPGLVERCSSWVVTCSPPPLFWGFLHSPVRPLLNQRLRVSTVPQGPWERVDEGTDQTLLRETSSPRRRTARPEFPPPVQTAEEDPGPGQLALCFHIHNCHTWAFRRSLQVHAREQSTGGPGSTQAGAGVFREHSLRGR